MPSAVHVANQLSELTHEALTQLMTERPFQWGRQRDLHDAADTLLSADSITPTLRRLSRASLDSLHRGAADSAARHLLLANNAGDPYPEVLALLPELTDTPVPTEPAPVTTDASTMLHTVCAIRDVLSWISDEPLPMSATGSVLKAEEKSLAYALVIPESEAHVIVWMAELAGYARTVDRRLRITDRGCESSDDLAGMWSAVVDSVIAQFPPSVLDEIRAHGRLDREFCEWAWPLRDANDSKLLAIIHLALGALGLVSGSTTEIGRAYLARDAESLQRIRATAFPELMTSVYVLDDLSIIAPGPITTDTARELDAVSRVETRGLASKRRIDAARILRSIVAGETVDALIARLGAHSITPLTPAVTSTISDIATNTRFVFLNGTGTDTAAKASHPELGEMLLTDPRLQRLAPVGVDAVTVLYGASRDRVETALIEGRYTVVSAERPSPPATTTAESPFDDLSAQLFAVGLGASHMERALLVAGKARARVTLVIDTGAELRTITLEPRQVANGRVRGLDTASDVERTLPISAIRELKPVGDTQ